ncbi:phage adaptor protein [Massilia sp. DD77]|uniref:phage adaptor protein n=1 Tax=Massilia sp. DD77 TaxID=3109349 RepID=UPI002FFF6F73
MPFANYTELRAAVVGWLHRSDLAGQIPDFIDLAERRFNRIAQVRLMENEVPLTLTAGSRSIALPDGFTAPLAVWLADVQPRDVLSAVVPEQLPVSSQAGRPRYWAVDGGNLAFDCPADAAYPVTLRYRGGFKLNDAAPTNTLLTKYPDLYLYGTLLESAPRIRDADSLALWQVMYDRAVKEINQAESRSRAVAPLRTELADLVGLR